MKMQLSAAALTAVLLSAPAHAMDPAMDPADAVAARVRAADIAFEKRAEEVGAAQAFKEYMDETDGLQFGSGEPTRGAEAIFKAMGGSSPPTSRLQWTPLQAWGSRGGDLGVTTGTWKATSVANPKSAITGRYVTVWRRNVHGDWKGLIDIGNPDPK